MVTLNKNTYLAEKVIFVDGMWGTGKSILGPILASFKNVEKHRYEHIYEYICSLSRLKKIEPDAVIALIRLYTDLNIYDAMISRGVNLRFSDESGLLNTPNPLHYITRLFHKDGQIVVDKIKKIKPILQITSHLMLPDIECVFNALEGRARVVEMVRHPLYMIEHWFHYIERCGKDPRDFALWIKYKDLVLPCFADGWEEEYQSLKAIDKAIHAISWLTERGEETYQKLNTENKKRVLFIPFEKLVIDPWTYLDKLKIFLDVEITPMINKVLKKQKCPRKFLSDGRGHKGYGWRKNNKKINDIIDFNKRKNFVESSASKKSLDILSKLCAKYEKKYDLYSQPPWSNMQENSLCVQ